MLDYIDDDSELACKQDSLYLWWDGHQHPLLTSLTGATFTTLSSQRDWNKNFKCLAWTRSCELSLHSRCFRGNAWLVGYCVPRPGSFVLATCFKQPVELTFLPLTLYLFWWLYYNTNIFSSGGNDQPSCK